MFKEFKVWHALMLVVITSVASIIVTQKGCVKSPEEKQAIEAKIEAVRVRRDNWIEQCAEKLTTHTWSECVHRIGRYCDDWQEKTETTAYNVRITACADTFDDAH